MGGPPQDGVDRAGFERADVQDRRGGSSLADVDEPRALGISSDDR
jgi:hypothetical protein